MTLTLSHLLLWVALPLAALIAAIMTILLTHPTYDDDDSPCVCGHVDAIHDARWQGVQCAGHECGCRRYEPEILAGVGR